MFNYLNKRKKDNPCLVITRNQDSWVIGGLIREAAQSIGRNFDVYYVTERRLKIQNPVHYINFNRIKNKEKIFFAHQKLFIRFATKGFFNSQSIKVFVTHLVGNDLFDLVKYDKYISTYIVMNSEVERQLNEKCISKTKIVKAYGAVDEKQYRQTNVNKKYALIVGKYSERKNGETIKKIILNNPNIEFKIHGDGWNKFFNNIVLPNLRIYPFKKSKNAKLISEAGCLLSISEMEGGPITVLEALSCRIPVIGSKTGFIPEIIKGDTGMIVSNHLDFKEISKCLRKILDNPDTYRGYKVLNFDMTFTRFGNQIFGKW